VSFGRLLRRWALPVVLAVVALGAWQAANRADFDPVDPTEVVYDRTLATPMLSGRRLPRTLRAPVSDDLIADEIDRIAEPIADQQSCLAVRNAERELGTTVDPPGGVIPASNQKLITTWAALELLGPEFTFRTRVVSPSAAVDGVLDGDLYLVGDGDPFLYTDDWIVQYPDTRDRHHTRLENLADAVVDAGVTAVTGSVVGDETLYDDVRYGPWDGRLIVQKQSGPLSALTVNEGFVDWPQEYRSALLRSETDAPPVHAASVFNQLLRERGVAVSGPPVAGAAPAGSLDITSIRSPTLADLATHVNSYSSNLGAELLLKRIGLEVGGVGSTEAGAAAVTELLTRDGLPMVDVAIRDGSGLAETNRLTCSLLVSLLAGEGPETPLGRSLAIGGTRGSLLERFVDSPADGLVLAKTGTLQGVRALSGYVLSDAPDTEPGRYVSFAQILNDDDIVEEETMLAVQEPLVNALVTYPTGPSIDELSPRAPTAN
jgi:D-alanyl-D-alanine carboxypeptidase/D-alanyl-D-alanine-endopeptidase (penicillin-binding protein 4)